MSKNSFKKIQDIVKKIPCSIETFICCFNFLLGTVTARSQPTELSTHPRFVGMGYPIAAVVSL